ncbi:MAG: peptidoglycan LD-endopeptidase LytH [Ilumatobacteraceae bacterium]
MRRFVCILSLACFVAPLVSTSGVGADDTDAEKAAKEIADARDRANAAADAYFASVSRLDEFAVEDGELQAEITALEGDVKALQLSVENVAIGRYTRSGSTGVPLLTGFSSSQDQIEEDALLEVIYDSSASDFDRLDSLNADLANKRQKLADSKVQAEKERTNLAVLKDQATTEVQRLKDVEATRLQGEGVRDALVAEQARRIREAGRKALVAAPPPVAISPASDTAPIPGVRTAGGSDSGGALPAVATRPELPDAGGGTTGGGGSGVNFSGPGNDYAGPGWVCPTGAAVAPFADTWGAPRSGGRRHEGVDLIGARGIPVLAVVDGIAEAKSNVLGGTTIVFHGADGNGYYYAHLDGYAKLGSVKAGDTIGFLGQSGNAQFSIAHLHFEIHPGEGPAVNPYPTVAAHCPSAG